jgi:hypothetical protein
MCRGYDRHDRDLSTLRRVHSDFAQGDRRVNASAMPSTFDNPGSGGNSFLLFPNNLFKQLWQLFCVIH